MKKEYNLLPGPSEILKKFSTNLTKTPISQRSDEFLKSWYNVKESLKLVLDNPYGEIAILTSSATGGMESSIVSLCDSKSKVLVISNGKFGDRFEAILSTYSINFKKLDFFINRKVDYDLIEKELKNEFLKERYTHIAYQICETSSGIFTDPEKINQLSLKYELITIADGVSAFLADYIFQKEYNIDALIIGSQKGLNAPAGICFVSLSQKAISLLKSVNTRSYYFNLSKYIGDPPFTPAINTIFYIEKILKEVEKIKYINIIKRNIDIANKIRRVCLQHDIRQYPLEPSNAVSVFEYYSSEDFIEFCKSKFNLHIAHGQGLLKAKVFRVGHFGLTPLKNYDIFLLALNKFIKNKKI